MAILTPGPRIPSRKSRKPPAAKIHTQNDIDRLWTDERKTERETLRTERAVRRRSQKPKGLHIIWRGRVLHIKGTYRGKQVRVSTGQSVKCVAESILADIRHEIDERLDFGRWAQRAVEHGLWPVPETILSPAVEASMTRPLAGVPESKRPSTLPATHSGSEDLARDGASVGSAGLMLAPSTDMVTKPRSSLAEGGRHPRPEPVPDGILRTFTEACDRYIDHQRRSDHAIATVRRLQAVVGSETLCKDVNDDLLQWLRGEMLRETSGDQSYLRTVVGPVKAVMNLVAVVWGPTQGCPAMRFATIAAGARRTTTLLPAHAELLIARAESLGYDMLANVIQVALCEGLRRSELFALTWEDIDRLHWHMFLRHTKGEHQERRERDITDPRPRTRQVVRRMLGGQRSATGPVFIDPTRRGFEVNGRGFSSTDAMGSILNEQLKELGEALGLPNHITLHILRHTAASYHYLIEPDLLAVMRRMDWKSLAITQRYVHELDVSLKPHVEAFWAGSS
jgi:hypothetical protein